MLHQIFKCDIVSKIATSSNLRRRVTVLNQRLQLFVNTGTRQFDTLNENKHIFGLDNITEEQNSELFEHV